ncbi:hypothetical protein CLV73_2347 [Chryseobacterium geocarposphaerae]|uniref:Uncharacterized protein n=1 Tax=Chryseobacterium geocarposphaerae TaxID=1416776 RepID=A0A2M9C0M9_9FLAO|nr:hypothetical protein CLV73_2347 [Chryseobacterium geocarposphaerae]
MLKGNREIFIGKIKVAGLQEKALSLYQLFFGNLTFIQQFMECLAI